MAESLKFYTDKHIPRAVTTQLRKRGVDVVRCEEVGLGDASDSVHLEYAAAEGRVVITHDTDFIRLHQEWQSQNKRHGGIMFCLHHIQGMTRVGRIVGEVMMYHDLISSGAGNAETDIANQLIFVS